jgi:hypothetical protein
MQPDHRCRDAEPSADQRYLYLLSGIRGDTATDISERRLAHHGGLRGLLRLDAVEPAPVRRCYAAR